MEEVSLQEMLAARERRSALQTRLLQQYKKSLISFTLNIPGPVKVLGWCSPSICHRLPADRGIAEGPPGSGPAYGNDQRKNRI